MRRALLIAATLLAAGCDSSYSPGEVEPEATRGIPEWVAPKFVVDPRSAVPPSFDDPEIVFNVPYRACSSWSDGRGPSDCATRTTRSVLSTGRDWRLGERYLLSFEFWIDPRLAERPYRAPGAVKTGGLSSRLSIARWSGAGDPKGQIFDLKVDARRGVTFLGRTCVPPSEFGRWHRFDMRLRWANDRTGFLEVRCHGDLYSGRPIYARSGFPTNQPLHCFPGNNCTPGVTKDPRRFEMQLGIILEPRVAGRYRAFSRVPPGGLTVKMRRVVERRLAVIFNRVEEILRAGARRAAPIGPPRGAV